MAKLQRTFKESYVKTLRDMVTMGVTTRQYAEETFQYDKSMERCVAGVYQPEGLLEKLNPEATAEADFQSAIALYEAYKDLPPIVASNEAFWVYLTHVDLFDYVKKRYPKVGTAEGGAKYILAHWFRNNEGGLIRTTLAGLWWSVYCSIDEERGERKYELTKILFTSFDFRVVRFGKSTLFRHREAMLGILQFFFDHKELDSSRLSTYGHFLIVYFNRLGGIKSLASLNRNYFYDECEKKLDILVNLGAKDSLTNNDNIYDL